MKAFRDGDFSDVGFLSVAELVFVLMGFGKEEREPGVFIEPAGARLEEDCGSLDFLVGSTGDIGDIGGVEWVPAEVRAAAFGIDVLFVGAVSDSTLEGVVALVNSVTDLTLVRRPLAC